MQIDYDYYARNIKEIINENFIKLRNTPQMCEILERARLSVGQFQTIFKIVKKNFDPGDIISMLKYTHVSFKQEKDNYEVIKFIAEIFDMNLLKEILSRLTGNLQYDDISHESPKNHSIQHQDFNSSKLFTKVYRILENAAEENDTKTIIEYVKNNGWQITQKNGTNCILYAAYKGNLKLVRLLQENGADPCSKNDEDVTILHYFCHNGSIEGVEFALRFINVNAITKTTKRTPLHIAAHGNYDQLCTFLCNQKGIKKDEKDSENLTPLGLALIEGKADAQRALRAKNCRSCI